jgi:hypothetical protein
MIVPPFSIKLWAAVPIPHPTSKTSLFLYFSKLAKSRICDSTRYFCLVTSSKYSLLPISLAECLILQGLSFQNLYTSSISFYGNYYI